jgi:FkbM family methyltransferase
MLLNIGKSMLDAAVLSAFEIESYAAHVPGLARPVIIRTGETDQQVFRKIFVRNEYRHDFLPAATSIIDAGANVGYSVLWFRARFPQARIVALEPDPRNFLCLQANCGHLDNVVLLQAALWKTDAELALQTTLDGKPMGSWSTRTLPAAVDAPQDTAMTRGYAMRSVMELAGIDRADLVKIDIEGAEKDVFEAEDLSWLDVTSVLTLEFHDRFRPGCTAAAQAALSRRPHETARKGENVWFRFAQ